MINITGLTDYYLNEKQKIEMTRVRTERNAVAKIDWVKRGIIISSILTR